ncbi:MAG TPA: HTTM domain-containing protein [Candidatus Obscuribacterales bacterium]
MNLRDTWYAWVRFLFEPASPLPMAIYRILYGLLVLAFCFLIGPDLHLWYGPDGVAPFPVAREWPEETLFDPLVLLPQTQESISFTFALLVASAICLTIGLFTRYSAILVLLSLLSFHHHNWLILNSGDTMMRIGALYLALSHAGDALSVDRLVSVWTSREVPAQKPPLKPPWAQRLLQLQLAIIYCQAFFAKIAGEMWVNGSALYYTLRLEDFRRFYIAGLVGNTQLLTILTWLSLAVEFSLFTLVWFRDLRYWVLAAGIIFHISIDILMNLPLFEYLMIIAFVSFIYPEDLTRAMNASKSFLERKLGPPSLVIYDGSSHRGKRVAETIRRIDIFGRLLLVNYKLDAATAHWSRLLHEDVLKESVYVRHRGTWLQGNSAWQFIVARLMLIPEEKPQPEPEKA